MTHKELEDAARKAALITPGAWVSETAVSGEEGIAVIALDPNVPPPFETPTRGMVCWIHSGLGAALNDDEALALGKHIALANPTAILALLEELATLKARQRTPGTVEVCNLCNGRVFNEGFCSYSTDASRKFPSGCPAITRPQG